MSPANDETHDVSRESFNTSPQHMKITVNTFGTRGDVQPYIALSLGLQRAGHTVRILTHQIFEPFVARYGLECHLMDLDPRQVLIHQTLYELGNNTFRINRWLREHFRPVLKDIFTNTYEANQDADLIINSGLSLAGWHVAEKLAIPALATMLWPMTPSRHMPGAQGRSAPDWLPFRGAVTYWSAKFFNQMFFFLMLPMVNECRQDILGLQPMRARDYWSLDSAHSGAPILYGYSPAVVPKPSDWSDRQQITGYWFLDTRETHHPEGKLRAFLAAGPSPVYLGFGSMVERTQEDAVSIIVDALRQTGQRAIWVSGWSDLEATRLPDFIYHTAEIPHDWLFPQMAAVIHHGGAGTTAEAMRSGIPQVVVPWFGDQYFWGQRVFSLGVGPRPIARSQLSTDRLVTAIDQAVSDEMMRVNATWLGNQIRREQGVENAVKLIETFARWGSFSQSLTSQIG